MTDAMTANVCCRVLVVDDDEHILEEFRQAFAAAAGDDATHELGNLEADLFGEPEPEQQAVAFDVVTCSQGEQAVAAVTQALARQRPFSIIFLDIRMPPGIDGIRAARQIRRIDARVMIVFITAYAEAQPQDVLQAVPPPEQVQYFRKPFQVADFVRMAAELSRF